VTASFWELTFFFQAGGFFRLADGRRDTQRIPDVTGKVISKIEGRVKSDGTTAVNLVGSFWVNTLLGFS
jgi:hypothetical protein